MKFIKVFENWFNLDTIESIRHAKSEEANKFIFTIYFVSGNTWNSETLELNKLTEYRNEFEKVINAKT